MRESKFQADLIRKIKRLFPGCEVLKNDPNYQQGIPDLVIFFHDRYAFLEVKKSRDAPSRPNQPFYVEKFGRWSFADTIYPENEEEVLHGLQQAFSSRRATRVS